MKKTISDDSNNALQAKGHPESSKEMSPINLRPEQAAKCLNTSRTMIYQLMDNGDLASYHIGSLRRIPVEAIHSYQAAQLAKAGLTLEAA